MVTPKPFSTAPPTTPAAAARVIAAESARLQRLVTDLLDLAPLDARTFSFQPIEHDVRRPVIVAVAAFTPIAERAGITLDVIPGDDAVNVVADPQRVTQIVGNLIDNAIRHAAARVVVTVTGDGTEAVIRVLDDGAGITSEAVADVFDRLNSQRGAGDRSGSGLGLAIVRQIATSMGGSAHVVQEAGGACFEVRFTLS